MKLWANVPEGHVTMFILVYNTCHITKIYWIQVDISCIAWLGFVAEIIEGSLAVKLPTIWTDEKQSRAERRESLEERRVEEKE